MLIDNLLDASILTGPLTLATVIVNIVLALALSLVVAWVYKTTHKGISYSQSFTFTLVLIGMLLAVVMMVIGNSLAIAFGAFGAFSLIRFRTAIKDPRDVSFILLVVAIGLAVGTGNYLIAITTTLIAVLLIYILNKTNFGSIRKYDFILSFSAETNLFSNDKMREVFGQYLKYDNLLNVTSREGGKTIDYNFNIKFIKPNELEKFTQALNQISGVANVEIISAKNDIEY